MTIIDMCSNSIELSYDTASQTGMLPTPLINFNVLTKKKKHLSIYFKYAKNKNQTN